MTRKPKAQPEAPPPSPSQLAERELISAAYGLVWAAGETQTAHRLRELADKVELGLTPY